MTSIALALLMQSEPRFVSASPLPGVPSIMIDRRLDGIGLAQQTSRAKNLQARILWVDGTANLDRVSSDEKVGGLVRKIKESGFNNIVFDVKPIVGFTLYPSALTPKLQEWKGQKLPLDYDPLAAMSREAKANGLSFMVSLNAFSEGHALFKLGPGYDHVEWQTVLYEPMPFVSITGQEFPLNPKASAVTDNDLVIVPDVSKIKPAPGAFAVSLDRLGRAVDGFEEPGELAKFPTLPKGGTILVGYGTGAEFLRRTVEGGVSVKLITKPAFLPITARPEQQYPVITNPYRPEVRARNLDFVREITSKYDVDGIVYDDRLRFGGLNADFSPEARAAFEKSLGHPVSNWPEDIFRWTMNFDLTRGIDPGPLYDEWFAFRVSTMQGWIRDVRSALPKGKQLGVYSGSWYGDYATYGQNYASPEMDAGFWFLTPKYRQGGIAPDIDFLMTGCYYGIPTLHEALGRAKPLGATIEAAGYLSNRVVRDTTWAYAGIALDQFKGDPDGLANALQAACASTQGVMVFDLSHDIEPMWPVFARAFAQPKTAPHTTTTLADVRKRRKELDRKGVKDPPLIILGGTSGIGF